MTPKDLFLLNKDRANELRAVTQQHWFKECLMVVRAQLMSSNGLSGEMLRGAVLYETTLLDLTEEPIDLEQVQTGLKHDIDDPRSEKTQSEKPTPPTPTK